MPTLRERVVMAIERETQREVLFDRDGWAICPGCDQSCTGKYVGRHCCTRCQKVVT